MELEKDKAMRDEAAKKLQASIKRLKQPKIKDIKKAKEIIGGRVKTLLTGKAEFMYIPETKRSIIVDKSIVGKALAVSTRGKKLISKKKQTAAVKGAQNRKEKEAINKDYLDLAQKYKPIMRKSADYLDLA